MATKKKPDLKMITKSSGKGRPKQPLERRKILSDNPHLNRISPPDVEMGATLDMEEVPADPPIPLNRYERECWDLITDTQRGYRNSAWIYRSDCSYLVATCALYGRWRQIREEIDKFMANNGSFVDDETGRAHPLLAQEASVLSKYHASLAALGLVPTRRQVSLGGNPDDTDDGLLAR